MPLFLRFFFFLWKVRHFLSCRQSKALKFPGFVYLRICRFIKLKFCLPRPFLDFPPFYPHGFLLVFVFSSELPGISLFLVFLRLTSVPHRVDPIFTIVLFDPLLPRLGVLWQQNRLEPFPPITGPTAPLSGPPSAPNFLGRAFPVLKTTYPHSGFYVVALCSPPPNYVFLASVPGRNFV